MFEWIAESLYRAEEVVKLEKIRHEVGPPQPSSVMEYRFIEGIKL